jgi:uncharacterized protein YndB with AHSA1/START domain
MSDAGGSMKTDFIAKASIEIDASMPRVWKALIDPAQIKEYLFGTEAVSDWKKGSPIRFKGIWEGKEYEDKGNILEMIPNKLLKYNFWSSLSGQEDTSANYATITIILSPFQNGTRLILTQDNNGTEESRDHSQSNWETVLAKIKMVCERQMSLHH